MRVIFTFVVLVFILFGTKLVEPVTQSTEHVRSALLELSHVNHNNETVNDLTDAQIDHIIKTINRFRAIIQNNKFRSKREVLTAANYRKVRYSSVYEAEAKFECDNIWGPEDFKSDGYTWRRVRETASQTGYSYDWDPRIQEMLIDPFNHSIVHAADEADTLRMALSPDVTEIGCFDKICDGIEYIACVTGHSIHEDAPLYTPETRCDMDEDCTLPGYPRCDTAFGLCDFDPLDVQFLAPVCKISPSPRIALLKEKCDVVRDTGSAISVAERQSIVNSVNEFRAMINKNCTLGLGVPKPASNYRKVNYNCALEKKAKFECISSLRPEMFISDNKTWRSSHRKTNDYNRRLALFHEGSPKARELLIDPDTATVRNGTGKAIFMKLFMSEDVTDIGCFVKICGDYEYIACKTNHDSNVPNDAPLYTPGQGCTTDANCTHPGYTLCDVASGLCDMSPKTILKPKGSPLICYSFKSPYVPPMFKEKCDGIYETGNEMSQAERISIVETVNKYRAMINNNCKLSLGVPKAASNYRKVKYNCFLEAESMFECSASTPYTSTKDTWRGWGKRYETRRSLFHRAAPDPYRWLLYPNNQTVRSDMNDAAFMHFFLSADVTEVGCWIKDCKDYEYIACKTNHDINLPYDAPLYTPGKRCNVDADCTLPEYPTCDAYLGLCDNKSHLEIKNEAAAHMCDEPQSVWMQQTMEQCGPGYNTGSNISNAERELIVNTVNHFRKLINNNCNFGKGIVKSTSNYRKVKYSCALEEDAKFECAEATSDNFNIDKYTLRSYRKSAGYYRTSVFPGLPPMKIEMLIDPSDQTVGAVGEKRSFVNLMMSPNVTEIGCFVRNCDGYEYIACLTGLPVIAPPYEPLYKPGNRCMANEDCTLPGYGICDTEAGLCDTS